MAGEFVTIETFRSVTEAEMARSLLEGAGIPAFLSDATLVSNVWLLGNAIGDVKLQIRAEHVDQALALLVPLAEKQRQRPKDPPAGTACLACGASMGNSDCCPACGWTYNVEMPEEEPADGADDDEFSGEDEGADRAS